jgi:hypothetical protein
MLHNVEYMEFKEVPADFHLLDMGSIDHKGEVWRVRGSLTPVWTRARASADSSWGILTAFPPEWKYLCGAYIDDCFGDSESAWLWNEANPIIHRVNSESWGWVKGRFVHDNVNPLTYKSDILSNASRAAAWILISLMFGASEIWNALKDNDPDFLPSVWALVFGAGAGPSEVLSWHQSDYAILRILTPSSWVRTNAENAKRGAIQKLLPTPSKEWRIVVQPTA